jgi:circadian clock protein KaiB
MEKKIITVRTGPKRHDAHHAKKWNFRLYIANRTFKSILAKENLKKICHEYLKGDCHVEIVDIIEHPEIAVRDQILAVPTLVYLRPEHDMMFVGDMSSESKVRDMLYMLNA